MEGELEDAKKHAARLELTQKQFEEMVKLHAWNVSVLFTPRQYKYWQRVMIAIYFLFSPVTVKKHPFN